MGHNQVYCVAERDSPLAQRRGGTSFITFLIKVLHIDAASSVKYLANKELSRASDRI
jgi:hypothetical protein